MFQILVVGLRASDHVGARQAHDDARQEAKRAFLDDKHVVDLETQGKKISIRAECGLCRPFGIATWRTVGAIRDIRLRSLTDAEIKASR